MGLELIYQAIPADSGFIELVRLLAQENPSQAEWTSHTPGLLQDWARAPHVPGLGKHIEQEAGGPISDWCRAAVTRYPGIETREYNAGKAITWWKFVLSPAYRDLFRATTIGAPADDDWSAPDGSFDALVRMVFLNAEPIAPGVAATQGAPVQYITPKETIAFGLALRTLDAHDAARHTNELSKRYRARPAEHDDHVHAITAFQNFWSCAANDGDGVLVVYD